MRRSSSRARSRFPSCASSRRHAFGGWPTRHRGAREARRADGRAAAPRHRRSPGLAADAAARRDVRRAAQQPRLRAGARDEHDSRRHVREPHQHEPARRARLHLRRELAVRVLAQRRSVFGRDRRSHRRHRAGRARSDARAQEDERDARDAGGADARERRDHAAAAGAVRNQRPHGRQACRRSSRTACR